MKALRFHGTKDLRIDEITRPLDSLHSMMQHILRPADQTIRECRSNEVRIKVAYCGLCGTDLVSSSS